MKGSFRTSCNVFWFNWYWLSCKFAGLWTRTCNQLAPKYVKENIRTWRKWELMTNFSYWQFPEDGRPWCIGKRWKHQAVVCDTHPVANTSRTAGIWPALKTLLQVLSAAAVCSVVVSHSVLLTSLGTSHGWGCDVVWRRLWLDSGNDLWPVVMAAGDLPSCAAPTPHPSTVRDIALVPPPNMYWVTRLLEYTLSPPQEYALAFSYFAGPIAIHLNLLKTIWDIEPEEGSFSTR